MDNCIRTQTRAQMIARGFVSIEYQMEQTLTRYKHKYKLSRTINALFQIANFIAMFLP